MSWVSLDMGDRRVVLRRWPDRRRDAICASFAQLALDRSAESGTRIGTAAAPLVRLRRAAVDWLASCSSTSDTLETGVEERPEGSRRERSSTTGSTPPTR